MIVLVGKQTKVIDGIVISEIGIGVMRATCRVNNKRYVFKFADNRENKDFSLVEIIVMKKYSNFIVSLKRHLIRIHVIVINHNSRSISGTIKKIG